MATEAASTSVLYLRVPPELKDAAEAFAVERGMTLTSAAVSLIERGLEEDANTSSVAELQRRLATTRSKLAQAETRVRDLEERLAESAQTSRVVAEQTRQVVGACPKCRKRVTGVDLIVERRCPHCGEALTPLLTPPQRGGATGLDQSEYLVLLGVLGVLVGLALVSGSGA